ncbi:hypothetical protein C8R47DRAFT_510267 [Mycena vitilis]|nr:hypothetical protein C8R47DRAFT_510267 [Mycena vitilis]
MLDHYYTPRDNHDLDSFSALPFPRHLDQPLTLPTNTAGMNMLDVDAPVEFLTGATNANANMGSRTTKAPAGELFQSITAIPGLESTSFEELRLETYLQSLVATGTARPQPAFARSGVIPPGFAAQFVGADASGEGAGEGAEGEGEGDADADALSGSYRSREGVKQGDEHEDGGHAQGGVERKGKARVRDVDMLDVEAPHPHPHPNAPVGRTRDPRLRAGDPRVRLHQHPHSTVGVGRAASFPPAGGEVGW